jgi:hypothetical protein
VTQAVAAQDALVADCQLGFQLAQVGGDGPGGGAWLRPEAEPVGGLNACLVVFVPVGQVSGYPDPHGEGHCLAGMLSPGQHGPPGWAVQKPGDVGPGHARNRCREIDELAVEAM